MSLTLSSCDGTRQFGGWEACFQLQVLSLTSCVILGGSQPPFPRLETGLRAGLMDIKGVKEGERERERESANVSEKPVWHLPLSRLLPFLQLLGRNTFVSSLNPLFLAPAPLTVLPANPLGSTIKRDPESDHFLPPVLSSGPTCFLPSPHWFPVSHWTPHLVLPSVKTSNSLASHLLE